MAAVVRTSRGVRLKALGLMRTPKRVLAAVQCAMTESAACAIIEQSRLTADTWASHAQGRLEYVESSLNQ